MTCLRTQAWSERFCVQSVPQNHGRAGWLLAGAREPVGDDPWGKRRSLGLPRRRRLNAEERDLLRFAIVQDREVVLGQVGGRSVLAVHHDVHLNQLRVYANYGRGILRAAPRRPAEGRQRERHNPSAL